MIKKIINTMWDKYQFDPHYKNEVLNWKNDPCVSRWQIRNRLSSLNKIGNKHYYLKTMFMSNGKVRIEAFSMKKRYIGKWF